ncbi:hypothetical protein QJQ45_006691 [Haematococcus lacustris]|nr:hypothetical protein QJQ45_006691 [Haematococcus lacustris]
MRQPLDIAALDPPTDVLLSSFARPPEKAMRREGPLMTGLRSDQEYDQFMKQHKHNKNPVLVQFGSTWCQKCHEILPAFIALSQQVCQRAPLVLCIDLGLDPWKFCFWAKLYTQLTYAVAQVDFMPERAKGMRYSPLFVFTRGGRKVDEVVGKDEQRLADHVWLHGDE